MWKVSQGLGFTSKYAAQQELEQDKVGDRKTKQKNLKKKVENRNREAIEELVIKGQT